MPPNFDQLQHLKALFASKSLKDRTTVVDTESQIMRNVDWAKVLMDMVQKQKLSLDSIADQLVVERDVLDEIILNNKCKLNVTERMHLYNLYKVLDRQNQPPKIAEQVESANSEIEVLSE